MLLLHLALTTRGDAGALAVRGQGRDLLAPHPLHAQALAGRGQALGEFVDVAGGVALGEVAAVVLAGQRGLDRLHLGGRDRTAR